MWDSGRRKKKSGSSCCIMNIAEDLIYVSINNIFDGISLMCVCFVAQSCPTLCDPKDCSLPDSSVHGDSPGKNSGVGCHALLQGIFPTQGSNPGPPHCRWIPYHLNHQGSPLFIQVQANTNIQFTFPIS